MAAMASFLPGNTLVKGFLPTKELKQTLDNPAFYEVNTEQYWALNPANNYHRAIADLPIALEKLETWAKTEDIGMADEYDLFSDDMKLVQPGDYAFIQFPTVAFGRAINWTWGELEKYALARQLNAMPESLNPINEKLRLLGEYFNKRDHYTIIYGFLARGIRGLFSQKGVSRQDSTFRPYATATPLIARDLVADLTNLFYFYAELFNLSNLSQLQLIIPPKLGRRLAEPYVDASGREDGTVQSHIRELGITDITVRNELKGSNLALHLTNEAESAAYDLAFDRMVVKASTYTPERHFFPRRVFDPFQVGTLKWEQRSVSATSGILIRQPNVFAYYDFNNSVA